MEAGSDFNYLAPWTLPGQTSGPPTNVQVNVYGTQQGTISGASPLTNFTPSQNASSSATTRYAQSGTWWKAGLILVCIAAAVVAVKVGFVSLPIILLIGLGCVIVLALYRRITKW